MLKLRQPGKHLTKFVEEHGGDALLREIQNVILKNPEKGATIAGTGEVRKLRIADEGRGKGKSGGFRVIYLDLPDKDRTFLVTIYGKGRKADLSSDEKGQIRELVKTLKSLP